MRILIILFLGLFFNELTAQGVNIDSLSHVDYNELHNSQLNDIWGYTDEFGNEYALVGAEKGFSVVNVTDPSNPVEVYWHSGSSSVPRDIKTNGDYAYITSESNDGLLIVDLSPLPGGPITSTSSYNGGAHNIYIDENGYGYIFGASGSQNGVIILDLFTDPMNPIEVGSYQNGYVHDGYVRGNTMYLAQTFIGIISIVDVTDKSNPILLGTKETPSSFAHNIWLSDDSNFVFTTDEVSDAYITAYDISDPANIIEVDRIQSNPGTGVIPHNTHVSGNFLITSYYADGVVIHDISDPSNMVEVGSYDTYPGTSNTMIGCWGAYPFLPSGNLLVTDMENGLYILGPSYTPVAKLEGLITNSVTSNPLQGVSVIIVGETQQTSSDLNGIYKTGVANTGTYDVIYERYGYETQVISTALTLGDTVFQDIQMVPLPDFDFKVNVQDEAGEPIFDAQIRLDYSISEINGATNGLGVENFTLYFEDNYDLIVGKWGYITECQEVFIDSSTIEMTVVLTEGYYDDFSFDFGWSVTSDANAGDWERIIPTGNSQGGNLSNPDIDSQQDCGKYAFITDGDQTISGNVQDGTVTLISPVFDATNLTDPYIYYERWFYCYYDFQPYNDTLEVVLSNGTDFVRIDAQGSDSLTFYEWIPVSKRISDYLTPTSSMQLFISASDSEISPNIVEAGFDNFIISDDNLLKTDEASKGDDALSVYPNPFDNFFTVEGISELDRDNICVMGINGNKVNVEITLLDNKIQVNAYNLSSGIYFLKTSVETYKLIKQ